MRDFTTQTRILYSFLPEGMATRATVMACGINESYTSSVIKQLIACGYLERRSTKVTAKKGKGTRRRKTTKAADRNPIRHLDYLVITRAGLKHLIEELGEEDNFLGYIETPVAPFSLQIPGGNEGIVRQLKIKEASVLFGLAGYETELNRLSNREDYPKNSLRALLAGPVEFCRPHADNEAPGQPFTPRFLTSREMAPKMNLPVKAGSQHMYSSHTGLLLGQDHAALVYRAGSHGTDWQGKAAARFSLAAGEVAFQATGNSYYSTGGIPTAFLFYKNTKELEATYRKVREGGIAAESKNRFGHPYSAFFAVPVSHYGVLQVQRFSQHGPDFGQAMVAEDWAQYMTPSGLGSIRLFPYTRDGQPIFCGLELNLKQLQAMESRLSMRPVDFGILVYDWQVEFYRRIFPGVRVWGVEG